MERLEELTQSTNQLAFLTTLTSKETDLHNTQSRAKRFLAIDATHRVSRLNRTNSCDDVIFTSADAKLVFFGLDNTVDIACCLISRYEKRVELIVRMHVAPILVL